MTGIAVCCGFNNYEFRPLDRAMNDAAILYTRLTESGSFGGTPDLTGGEVFTQQTRADAILSALTRAAMSTATLVWFSFSGHATVSEGGELRLLLPGWRYGASEAEQRTYSIGAGEIEQILRSRLHSKRFVVVLDTCHSGAFGAATVTRDIRIAVEEQIASAGAVVIASCARGQLASDGNSASRDLNGAFTAAVIDVLEDHIRRRAPLTVLDLYREARSRIQNGQTPTLYVKGLTDDFLILDGEPPASPSDGIVALAAEVPEVLQGELSAFLHSIVQIRRRRRIGLAYAQRQLESLAAEFYRYGDDSFVVRGDNANVVEVFDRARTSLVGCTTPALLEEWRRTGIPLLRANRRLIERGGRVVRFFFVRDGFDREVPCVLDVVREHAAAGVLAVVVNVDSFDPAVLQEVFEDARPDDLSALECVFVDGAVFLRTHFAATGDLKIELDQRPTRCHHEYRTHIRPFLSSDGVLLLASPSDGGDGVVLEPLGADDISELREQLDADLGGSPIPAGPVLTPGGARGPAGGSRAANCRRPSRRGRG